MTDYTKFRKSLKNLELQWQHYANKDGFSAEYMQEAVAESVIHRFEICYDCLWKTLKRHIVFELGVHDAPNSPKPMFRLALDNMLISSPIERWIDYANARIGTTHDYSEIKANQCLALIPNFVQDAIQLYETISKTNWNEQDTDT